MSRLLAVLLLAGCGSSSGAVDGGALDGGGPDLAVDGGALADVGLAPGCACAPFEQCVDGRCGCGDDPLCGTAGFATFPVVPPAERMLTARGEVVDDALTGLSWERAMDGTPRTHEEALQRCAALGLDGHDDWRLPARVELATILDATRTPSLDGEAFGASVADYVWTASVAATDRGRAYAIYFGQGETILATAALAGGHVRCVRGARQPAAPRTIEGDWLVDPGTGLEWSVALESPSSLADARTACTGRGARVPSLYELHALVDEGRSAPALDPALEGAATPVWSTDERDFGEVLAWVMDFREGTSELRAVSGSVATRCVRDGG